MTLYTHHHEHQGSQEEGRILSVNSFAQHSYMRFHLATIVERLLGQLLRLLLHRCKHAECFHASNYPIVS